MSPPAEETKKRKHKGEPRESRKKRKQEEKLLEVERAAEQEDPARIVQAEPQPDPTCLPDSESSKLSDKKTDKKKKKQQERQDTQIAQSRSDSTTPSSAQVGTATTQPNTFLDINGDTELPDAPETLPTEPIEQLEESWPYTARSTEEMVPGQLQSSALTAFYSTRISLYVSVPSISLDAPLPAICALHLSPLLLTYYPPVNGIVLAYQDAILSAPPQKGLNRPLSAPTTIKSHHNEPSSRAPSDTLALVAEDSAHPWLWLTATFLVYNPQPTDELTGVINAQSEGLIGLVAYNYFQTSIARDRIPKHWTWSGAAPHTSESASTQHPHQRRPKSRKGRLNDRDGPSQESNEPDTQQKLAYDEANSDEVQTTRDQEHELELELDEDEDEDPSSSAGTFIDSQTTLPIASVQKFRIVDSELVPGYTRSTLSVQTEGTLLSAAEEEVVRERERVEFEGRNVKGRGRGRMMSGAIGAGV